MRDDLHQPVVGEAAHCFGDGGTAGAVVLREGGDGGQRVAAGPFARAGPAAPLRRARETAAAIAAATGLSVQLESRLRERWNWDGTQPFDSFLADWDRSAQDRDFTPGNGESSRSAGERMRAFVAGLSGTPGPVAAVSHGGVTTDLLRTLLGDEALPPRLLAEGIPPCAVTTLDGLHVVAIASTSHLG